LKIREIAETNNIPVIEDRQLARSFTLRQKSTG
jgi:flagellar biosynthesis protein FlhB